MRYFVTSLLWLSLEKYYNAGLTSERAQEVIEQMRDPYGPNTKLLCTSAGYNGNWRVETAALGPDALEDVAERIHIALELELRTQRKGQAQPITPGI